MLCQILVQWLLVNISGIKRCLILKEEREERQLRKAEMEMTKAENMVEHGAEIFAKPPRTWFQTERRKQEVARAEREQAAEAPAHRSKREKDAEKNALKRKRGVEMDGSNQKKKSKLMQVSSSSRSSVSSWKIACCRQST